MHAAALALIALTGCAYKAGSFKSMVQDFDGTRASAGCLDISVDRRPDVDRGPVLAYAFGNRCEEPAMVDLADAVVVGRAGDQILRLSPFDPREEIVARRIDARAVGGEAIAYVSTARMPELCVDTASIAQVPGHSWLCFADMEAE